MLNVIKNKISPKNQKQSTLTDDNARKTLKTNKLSITKPNYSKKRKLLIVGCSFLLVAGVFAPFLSNKYLWSMVQDGAANLNAIIIPSSLAVILIASMIVSLIKLVNKTDKLNKTNAKILTTGSVLLFFGLGIAASIPLGVFNNLFGMVQDQTLNSLDIMKNGVENINGESMKAIWNNADGVQKGVMITLAVVVFVALIVGLSMLIYGAVKKRYPHARKDENNSLHEQQQRKVSNASEATTYDEESETASQNVNSMKYVIKNTLSSLGADQSTLGDVDELSNKNILTLNLMINSQKTIKLSSVKGFISSALGQQRESMNQAGSKHSTTQHRNATRYIPAKRGSGSSDDLTNASTFMSNGSAFNPCKSSSQNSLNDQNGNARLSTSETNVTHLRRINPNHSRSYDESVDSITLNQLHNNQNGARINVSQTHQDDIRNGFTDFDNVSLSQSQQSPSALEQQQPKPRKSVTFTTTTNNLNSTPSSSIESLTGTTQGFRPNTHDHSSNNLNLN